MEITKGVTLEYKDGKIVASLEVAKALVPALEVIEAKVESGEIDPVKGTDLDKAAMLKAIAFLKVAVA